MTRVTPVVLAVLIVELAPAAAFAFASDATTRAIGRLPPVVRLLLPSLLVLPYIVIASSNQILRWQWLVLYIALPVAIAWLLQQATETDSLQHGNWRDALILLTLGLAVDLRWFDSAWPRGQEAFGKILLVDAGLYGFFAIRHLTGAGFDFRLKWSDWTTGLRELGFFAPAVLVLGIALGFIHPHTNSPSVLNALLRWLEIFFFVAMPEELFFRGWVQNLLERRFTPRVALLVASVLFGLSHFNKRSPTFNWRYVLVATMAGIFYGRAWRQRRRLAASTITHTFVDWLWSWWF